MVDIKEFTNCKEPFRAGMVFRSEEHPEKDMLIESVCYLPGDSLIEWTLINAEAFDKFLQTKKIVSESTYPYPVFGACKHSSMKTYIKKHGLTLQKTEKADVSIHGEIFKEFVDKDAIFKYNKEWQNYFN